MPRDAASIQAEIDALEARMTDPSTAGMLSMSDGGTSAAFNDIEKMGRRLDLLYAQLARANGTKRMWGRGRVVGLPGGPVGSNP